MAGVMNQKKIKPQAKRGFYPLSAGVDGKITKYM
jgi:hypothetical protein